MRLQPSQPLSRTSDLEAQRRERLESLLHRERQALASPKPHRPAEPEAPASAFTPPGLKRR